MDTAELNQAEKKWLKKLQKTLDECPSSRLGFYTTGDATITVYDTTNESKFDTSIDFPDAVGRAEAELDWITFPSNVISTVG